MSNTGRLVIDDLTRGRDGSLPAWAIDNKHCADAVNVDWYRCTFGRKRGGMTVIGLTFSSGGPFLGSYFDTLIRHVPGSDDTLAELWAVDSNQLWGRLAGATTWTAPTFKDASTGGLCQITGTSINGKLALAYKSAVARMHGWDTATVRRFGLAASAAPTAANGGGAGVATLRYYRERSTRQAAGVTIGRSEPSASVSFTPGANGVTVTQAAVINEGETHWEVEGSVDGVTFYRIATVVIGTTTYLDNANPTSYNLSPLSAATGTYTLQKPYRYIRADQNRLLGFGSYTATDKQSRVEFSAVIGSLDVGDEERVDTTTNYYIDLDEADSGGASGLAGPVLGSFFAFKFKQVWRLTPTGQVSQPFRADAISKVIGAVSHRSITVGEDADGNPCLYWMSHRGPYRWGTKGLEYIGREVEDWVLGPNATIKRDVGADDSVAHTQYYQDLRQVWFVSRVLDAVSVGSRILLVYDVLSGGWSRFESLVGGPDNIGNAVCSTMFSVTIAASMSSDLKPYFGDAFGQIAKCDSGTTDTGNVFKAYIRTKAYEPGGPGFYGQMGDAMVLAANGANAATLTIIVTPDFGQVTASANNDAKTATVVVPALFGTGVTRSELRCEDSTLSGYKFYDYTIGDATALTQKWTLDRVQVPFTRHEASS